MAELNLNQIQNRLNELFVTYGERKLIFWFDAKKEFEEDIRNGRIVLNDAIIYILEPDEQFKTKRFFEIEDTSNNYLVYAPFKRMNDDDKNNHLLSLLKYSQSFSADRISIIMKQLGIPTHMLQIVERYAKFFGSKARISAFSKVTNNDIETEEELMLTLMAVLAKANTPQFYSILQAFFIEYVNGSNEMYDQLAMYDLKEVFWKYVSKYYGYKSEDPTIQKLAIVFFVNTFYAQLGKQELPKSLSEYKVIDQTTAIVSFMDGVMNDRRYKETFEKLSHEIYHLINGNKLLDQASIEELIGSDIFEEVHDRVIKFFVGQFNSGDFTPTIGSLTIDAVVIQRQRAHFGNRYKHSYQVIVNAQGILNYVLETSVSGFSNLVNTYEKNAYKIDRFYRKFIWHLDQVENRELFMDLVVIIEQRYKSFLDEYGRLWNQMIDWQERPSMLDFYDSFASNQSKTVVIISDALRYEAALELEETLKNEKKYSTKVNTIFSVLPSVTEFGKAASLRGKNEHIDYIDMQDVRVNGMRSNGTINRDKILKVKNPDSLAITYEEIIAKSNAKDLRDIFNGKDIIYLYHDQIDRTGDHGQETQVFEAVEKTIKELKTLISFISNGANVYRFVVTSDHGFIYSRSKIAEHDKIDNPSISESDRVERRFIISQNNYKDIGISSIKLGDAIRNKDERFIHFPETSAIFKKAGGGQNYVHGGSSPQEMIVPVVEVRVARGSSQKEQVTVQLMTPKRKVVGLSVALEFYQTEAISDSVTKAHYSLYYEDQKGNRVSNENSYFADSTEILASERFTKFTFEFINRNYESNEPVFLIISDKETKIEIERIAFVIDNPFAGGFGFDI